MNNINISARRSYNKMGIINERWEWENANKYVDRLSIKTPSLKQLVKNLSGGNQQKIILARWLSENIKVILLDEPTRGIDVGAKSEIHNIISQLASDGIGILVVSSELPEVLGISDRIIVMCGGKIKAQLTRKEATEEKILQLALPDNNNYLVV